MTRQEAILHLKAARLMLLAPNGQPISDLYDALTIAIEALERIVNRRASDEAD